jgi:hypothetical protein
LLSIEFWIIILPYLKYRNFTDKQRQIKKIKKSLAQAGKIQQTLMPKSDPNLDGFDIAGTDDINRNRWHKRSLQLTK